MNLPAANCWQGIPARQRQQLLRLPSATIEIKTAWRDNEQVGGKLSDFRPGDIRATLLFGRKSVLAAGDFNDARRQFP